MAGEAEADEPLAVDFLGHFFQQRNAPFVHPNAFVSKDQLASNQDLLSDLLHRYEKEFERIRELFDKQSAQQALIGFEEMEPELEEYEVD